MQIRTTWTRFEAFEGIFQVFEKDFNHSKPNSNHLNEIRSIRSIRMEIWTIQKGV